jgi:FkbM family methyltransferase
MEIITRFIQIYNKLIFCIRVAAGPGTFIRLLVNSKRLDRYHGKAVANGEPVAYSIRYLSRDWTLYLRTYAGDIRIFYEIFLEEIYRLPASVVREPLVIVDAGANIGMAGVYFSSVYPRARIYCIEPDAGNVEVLKKSLGGLIKDGSVVLVEAALHDKDEMVNLSGDGWAYNYAILDIDMGGVKVPGITPASLIARFGLGWIDLLKMDIEGAEDGLFRGDIAWLDNVGVLLIEVHTEEGKTLVGGRLRERGFVMEVMRDSLFLAYRK